MLGLDGLQRMRPYWGELQKGFSAVLPGVSGGGAISMFVSFISDSIHRGQLFCSKFRILSGNIILLMPFCGAEFWRREAQMATRFFPPGCWVVSARPLPSPRHRWLELIQPVCSKRGPNGRKSQCEFPFRRFLATLGDFTVRSSAAAGGVSGRRRHSRGCAPVSISVRVRAVGRSDHQSLALPHETVEP